MPHTSDSACRRNSKPLFELFKRRPARTFSKRLQVKHDVKLTEYTHPAGGWGSVQSLWRSLTRERVPFSGTRILLHQNKPEGFACVSCSWAKPAEPRPFEFCEEGAKATTWEITNRRCGLDFFAEHTVTSLEIVERPCAGGAGPAHRTRSGTTRPPTSMCRSSWEDAIADIAGELRQLES